MGQIHGREKFPNRYAKLEDEVRRLRGAQIQPESFITMPAVVGDISPSIATEGLLIVACKILVYDGGAANVSFKVYRQNPPIDQPNVITLTTGDGSGPNPWVDDTVYYEMEEDDLFFPTVNTADATMLTCTFNTISS